MSILKKIDGYLAVDISEVKPEYVAIDIETENYNTALDWAISKFGNYGEGNWWPAPYLIEDKEDNNHLVQKYEFVFTTSDQAVQFKLMGF